MSNMKRKVSDTSENESVPGSGSTSSRSPDRRVRARRAPEDVSAPAVLVSLCLSLFSQVIESLNLTFSTWLNTFLNSDEYQELARNAQDPNQLMLLTGHVCEYQRIYKIFKDLLNQKPDSRVLLWGYNDYGELSDRKRGLRHGGTSQYPRELVYLDKIQAFSAGAQHMLASYKDGTVYSWGSSDMGQLGRNTTGDESNTTETVPHKVENFIYPTPDGGTAKDDQRIIDVAAGEASSVCLSVDGRVYFFGCILDEYNKAYRTATFEDDGSQDLQGSHQTPAYIPITGKVKAIATGKLQCMFLRQDHSLQSLGIPMDFEGADSTGSALGRPTDFNRFHSYDAQYKRELLTPRPVQWAPGTPKQVVLSVACGPYFTIVASRPAGSMQSFVFGCGTNGDGQLGLGHTNHTTVFTMAESSRGKNIVEVHAGRDHSLGVDLNRRRLFGTGSAKDGRLGMFDTSQGDRRVTEWTPIPFPDAEIEIMSVAVGVSHNLVSTKKNEVYSWGLGEFGQLGHGRQDGETAVNVEHRPRKLDVTQEIADDAHPEDRNIVIHKVDAGAEFSAVLFSRAP